MIDRRQTSLAPGSSDIVHIDMHLTLNDGLAENNLRSHSKGAWKGANSGSEHRKSNKPSPASDVPRRIEKRLLSDLSKEIR